MLKIMLAESTPTQYVKGKWTKVTAEFTESTSLAPPAKFSELNPQISLSITQHSLGLYNGHCIHLNWNLSSLDVNSVQLASILGPFHWSSFCQLHSISLYCKWQKAERGIWPEVEKNCLAIMVLVSVSNGSILHYMVDYILCWCSMWVYLALWNFTHCTDTLLNHMDMPLGHNKSSTCFHGYISLQVDLWTASLGYLLILVHSR